MKAICMRVDWDVPVEFTRGVNQSYLDEDEAYEKAGLPYSDVEIPEEVTDPYLDCDDDEDDDEDAVYDAIADWLTKKYGKGKYRATNIELEWC